MAARKGGWQSGGQWLPDPPPIEAPEPGWYAGPDTPGTGSLVRCDTFPDAVSVLEAATGRLPAGAVWIIVHEQAARRQNGEPTSAVVRMVTEYRYQLAAWEGTPVWDQVTQVGPARIVQHQDTAKQTRAASSGDDPDTRDD